MVDKHEKKMILWPPHHSFSVPAMIKQEVETEQEDDDTRRAPKDDKLGRWLRYCMVVA